MPLDTASKKALTDLGFDVEALTKAITSTGDNPFKLTPKTGEIKIGDSTYHIYDDAGHNGLKGRVKDETLKQSTELGVKAIAAEFDVDYKGNDPKKLKEAVVAKLGVPVDEKVKEKERDIETMRNNWTTEKQKREQAEARLKDREDTDRDLGWFPDNTIKSVKAQTLRRELIDEGITYGEHEENGVKVPAVFVNGVVQKTSDLKIIPPKTFNEDHFKTKGWIQEAAPAAPPKKTTLDVGGNSGQAKAPFDHASAYTRILEANGGKWDAKAQSQYTNEMVAANSTK